MLTSMRRERHVASRSTARWSLSKWNMGLRVGHGCREAERSEHLCAEGGDLDEGSCVEAEHVEGARLEVCLAGAPDVVGGGRLAVGASGYESPFAGAVGAEDVAEEVSDRVASFESCELGGHAEPHVGSKERDHCVGVTSGVGVHVALQH